VKFAQKKIAKSLFVFLLLAAGLLFSRFVLAADFGTNTVGNTLNGSLGNQGTDPRTLISNIINLALGFLGLIAIGIIIWGGFIWMTSNGDEAKVETAKKVLKNGIIGLIIVLSSWAIATFLINKFSGTGGVNGGDGSGCVSGQVEPCGGCGGSMACSNGTWGSCVGSDYGNCLTPPTSCDSNAILPGCQAANQICAAGDYCDNSCLCQPKAQLGASCDANTTNLTCDPDNSRCSDYLTCDPNSCLCVGPPVITAVSPLGGFCKLNSNKSCSQDTDCGASDTCDLATPNGAANNFITVTGKNFGTYSATTSKVVFLGTSAEKEALSPATVNSSCVNFWRDDQIIIAVPAGVQTGAIEVVNKDNLKDTTNDGVGPKLNDFQANSISRPGLCSIDPTQGTLSSKVNYQGVNLYSGKAYFGNYQSNVSALYSTFTNPSGLTGTSTTPNIQSGPSGSFVETMVSGTVQKSNFLKFVKSPEEGEGPYIMSFSPSEGSAGQYVTVKGAGFGGAKGNNHFYFASGNNKIEADYTFPAICSNSVWKDNQVIVKVPTGIANDSYQLQISLGSTTITTENLNPNVFKVDSNLALKPSLCKIDPEQGAISTPVTLWGEYFGKAKDEGLVQFNYEKNATGEVGVEKDGANTINTAVPADAITGPVKVVKSTGAGNELNFNVSECAVNSDCNNQICCPQNTYRKGRCVSSVNECFINIPTSVFEWNFSTSFNATLTPPFSSCQGLSKYLGSCSTGATCPNSPGACSSPSVATKKNVGTCNITCNDVPGCTAATCIYNASLDKCVKKSTHIVSDCDLPEIVVPAKGSDLKDDRNIPRIMFWPGKINQHWNLSTGIWESDTDEKSGAEVDKLAYCKKFYPTTVSVEAYKMETSSTWHAGGNKTYYGSTKQSYKCVLSVGLDNLQKTCNSSGNWEVKLAGSCPSGWVRGANNVCVQTGSVCNSCSANLSCEKVNQFNTCVSDKLCAGKANCIDNKTNALDDCILDVPPSCECCCRIGYDKQDCCAPLTCAGKCGSDLTDNSNTYGSCSGCAAVGNTTAEHDNACNCASSTGKFCDIAPDHPQGVCSDCATIDDPKNCGDHSSSCCFDSNKTAATTDDTCRGLNGSSILSLISSSPDYGYCAYFGCAKEDPLKCASTTPLKIGFFNKVDTCIGDCPKGVGDVCSTFNNNKESCSNENGCCYDKATDKCLSGNQITSTNSSTLDAYGYCAYYNCSTDGTLTCDKNAAVTGTFLDTVSCDDKCKNPPAGAGLGCVDAASNANSTCNFGLCTFAGSSCLQATGDLGAFPSCGTCCCQPGANDSCATALTPNLRCKADQGACSGASRGLCCGCSSDNDCGSAATTGCGSDTCCEARPNVSTTLPKINDTNVCRNASIKITFNQAMDPTSFANNFLLFEEKAYGNGTCPAGTFLADANTIKEIQYSQNKNIFVRLWENISSRVVAIFQKENKQVLATPPDAAKLYCAISGTVSSEEVGAQTSLIFTPSKVLSPATKYYAIIKGDEALNSQTGVLSASKIGMNEGGFKNTAIDFVSSDVAKFNGKAYLHSYSFQFTTLSDQGVSAGICAVDHVNIGPSSYLFKTTKNDLNEKDTSILSGNFDTVADRDKVFSAGAYSSSNQLLHPVAGYAWSWNWAVSDPSVADISNEVTDLPSDSKLIAAKDGVTDGQTKLSATVDMHIFNPAISSCGSSCNAYFAGDGETKLSNIYVFVCNNPWPAVKSDGSWSPWNDVGGNCTTGSGTCESFNYQFYYCRDAGTNGTLDDLPSINNNPVVRSGSLICSSDNTSCSVINSACGSGGSGVCYWSILKESYFFREANISGGQITNAVNTGKGGEVQVDWTSLVTGVKSFRIYYLPSSNGTMISKDVSIAAGCSLSTDKLTYNCSTKINNLINGKSYIFKLTVLSTNNVESPLSTEKVATPSDTTPPAIPLNLSAQIKDSQINFSWKANSDDTAVYRLYHGITPGQYAESFDSNGTSTSMSITPSQFTNDFQYFALSAIDASKNESVKSVEKGFYFNVNDTVNPLWSRAASAVETTAGTACIVKMDTDPASSTKAICSDNLNFTKPGLFAGTIKSASGSPYCSLSSCPNAVNPNKCAYFVGSWANHCYVPGK